MSSRIKDRISDDEFIKVCLQSQSMANACALLGLHFNSFKRRAIELNCYKPNQSGKGRVKSLPPKIPLDEILEGKHPHFQTFKLKSRLIKSKILDYECSICGLFEWKGQSLSLELDHVDGNSKNHRMENLRLLCPNCHSQTSTFRSKNRSKKNLSALKEI